MKEASRGFRRQEGVKGRQAVGEGGRQYVKEAGRGLRRQAGAFQRQSELIWF